jgi:hypothetical protein
LSSWGRGMGVPTRSCQNGASRHALCQDSSVARVRVNGSRLNTSTADLLAGVKYEPFGECRVFRVSMDSHKLQSSGSLAPALSRRAPSSTGRDGIRTVLPSVFEGGESVMDGCALVAAGNAAPGRRCSGLSPVAFPPARTGLAWGTDLGRPRSVATRLRRVGGRVPIPSSPAVMGAATSLRGLRRPSFLKAPPHACDDNCLIHQASIAMQTNRCKRTIASKDHSPTAQPKQGPPTAPKLFTRNKNKTIQASNVRQAGAKAIATQPSCVARV